MPVHNSSNATNWVDLLLYTSRVTNGALGPFLLLIVFMVSFITLRIRYGDLKSFAVSSWTTMIIALLLLNMTLITWQIFMIPVVMSVGSIFLTFYNKDN